ncbi:unnamed protein product [Amoebophrya sp. A120]|nr:unnamed protein product [Amoebophrya sp. A120]|eukprot:GSA120T00023286001.1
MRLFSRFFLCGLPSVLTSFSISVEAIRKIAQRRSSPVIFRTSLQRTAALPIWKLRPTTALWKNDNHKTSMPATSKAALRASTSGSSSSSSSGDNYDGTSAKPTFALGPYGQQAKPASTVVGVAVRNKDGATSSTGREPQGGITAEVTGKTRVFHKKVRGNYYGEDGEEAGSAGGENGISAWKRASFSTSAAEETDAQGNGKSSTDGQFLQKFGYMVSTVDPMEQFDHVMGMEESEE